MGQRVFLPWDVGLDIGAINLKPDSTNIGISANHDYQRYRSHGEKYDSYRPAQFSRMVSIAGVYHSKAAEDLKTLINNSTISTYRLQIDTEGTGAERHCWAGQLLINGWDYEANVSDGGPTTVRGDAMTTGPCWMGDGERAIQAANVTLGLEYEAAIVKITTAGVETDDPANSEVYLTAQASGETWTAAIPNPGVGVHLLVLAETADTSGAARPTMGTWNLRVRSRNWDTAPVGVWTALRKEGNTDG